MKDDFKYPYAKTDDDKLICIESINKDNRNDHHYYCYGCGKELVPVLGNIREHHFRHKEKSVNCDRNKYLHEFAKNVIKERFDKSEHFYVKYNAKRKCENKDNCDLVKYGWKECYADDLYEIDLKKHYDTCECEKEYFVDTESGKKRADLMLFDSKDKSRFLTIEIWVTHKCEEEKKNNKIRIIEIKIEKEADAYREIVENIDGELPIYFYGFKRNVKLDPSKKLFFNKIGLNNVYEKREVLCSDMKSFDEECKYALFADILDLETDDKFNIISIMLNKKGFIVNNCLLCGYMRYDSLWKKEFCEKYRMEKNTCYKNKKYERCPYYKYASNKGDHLMHEFEEVLYWEKK